MKNRRSLMDNENGRACNHTTAAHLERRAN
jgi:hypothetical protein